MESFEECARREVMEETGLELDSVEFQLLANLKDYKPKHYVHIGVVATAATGKPEALEPDKTVSWDWYSLDQLPRPLFTACQLQIESIKNGGIYFDN